MKKFLSVALVGALVLGCSAEMFGSSSEALLGTSYSGSTRTPIGLPPANDNTPITVDTTFAPPGGGGTGTPGVCWFQQLIGSFRGAGEWAVIGTNPSTGNYQLQLQSNTSYDSTYNVGPIATIYCAALTDLGITAGQVGDFGSAFSNSGTAISASFGGPTPEFISVSTTHWAPFSGLNGRIMNDGAHRAGTDEAHVTPVLSDFEVYSGEGTCSGSSTKCQVTTYTWDISGSSESFTYNHTDSATDVDANIQDITLETATGNLCWVSGISGYTNGASTVETDVEPDGNWHLVVVAPATPGWHTTGYAECMAVPHAY